MEPVSLIVTALAAGAAAAFKDTAESAVKDAYAGLKKIIQDRYRAASIPVLEDDPSSKARQQIVKEDLGKTEAARDEEVLQQAKALLEAVQAHAPGAAATVGVDLEDIKGAALEIEKIIAEGRGATGVKGRGLDIRGDIKIKDVQARSGDAPPKA